MGERTDHHNGLARFSKQRDARAAADMLRPEIGGGFGPRMEGEGAELASGGGHIVGFPTDDLATAERAERRLAEAGAERVDRADEAGYPVVIHSRERDETRPV